MGLFSGVDGVLNNAKSGNFDELLSNAKVVAEDAAKKSAERLEISKKKIELLDSKTKLSKAYEKYGKLQFALLEGEDVDEIEVERLVDEIQLYKSRAELLTAEVEELKAAFLESLSKSINHRAEAKSKKNDVNVDAVEVDE